MEAKGKRRETRKRGGLIKLLLAGLGALLFSRLFRSAEGDRVEAEFEQERKFKRLVFRGWLVVVGIALAFTAYGFFAFFVISDKGPPDWDYGSVQDVPGQSVYSTYPYRGRLVQPEQQHVNQKPAGAAGGVRAAPELIFGDQPAKESSGR